MESLTSAATYAGMASRQGRDPQPVEDEQVAETEPHRFGPVAWRPLPNVAAEWQQKGVWGEQISSQVPARVSGAQRGSVAGTLYPGWQVSAGQLTPNWQRTQVPAHFSGSQRRSGQPSRQGPASASVAATAYRVTGAAATAQAATLQAQLRAWGSR